jgi:predicted negative regulator of RcsB-dependent stress response
VSEHLTRKELKTDQVALTLESAFDYVQIHQKQAIQVAAAVVLAAALVVGGYFWWDHARTVREEKLSAAMQIASAPVGPARPNTLTYPTQAEKDTAEQKAFSDMAAQYGGSREGAIAEYTLAGVATSAGRNDEARKRYAQVVDSGDKEYRALAKISLAQLDFSEGKDADGEKLLHELMDSPTAVVSKDQATMTLARLIARKRPSEARALLAPLVKEPGEVGQIAQAAQAEIQGK